MSTLKPKISGKHSEKFLKNEKKQQSTENQKNTKYRNISQVEAHILDISFQGEVRSPVPVSYAADHGDCCSTPK